MGQHRSKHLFLKENLAPNNDPRELEDLGLHRYFLGLGFLHLGNLSCRLGTQGTTTPVTPDLVSSLVEVGLDRFNELVQR